MNNKDKGYLYIGLGLAFVVLGAIKIIEGDLSRPRGRWSGLFGSIYDAFGPYGPPALWVTLGVSMVIVGYLLRRKK